MSTSLSAHHLCRAEARALQLQNHDSDFADWARGYGVIEHSALTQCRVYDMVDMLVTTGKAQSRQEVYAKLEAADRITSAAMWLVVHMTYAQRIQLDGTEYEKLDFKQNPEGHTGGALNMVPAYTGYMLANALSGETRSWLMGQGHCAAAIDAVNALLDNLTAVQAERYDLTDSGLSRMVSDFYSGEITADGKPASPLGSHVNATTGGGLIEGGYLGFAELLYPHMPLKTEKLVAFLSDGAFEEQRGSDWAPRWWRAEDTGLVAPIMIANGRRIDQRTSMAQSGGVDWFREHLRLNRFDPIDLDGRDPAAFAWVIFEIEARQEACATAIAQGDAHYPVPLNYGIAETIKGFGFPGAGTNRAHNLPLEGNPSSDEAARSAFNTAARRLWVSADDIKRSASLLNNHDLNKRAKERDHPILSRPPREVSHPKVDWSEGDDSSARSPMEAIDAYVSALYSGNPDIRVRIGNPDEMRSNRLNLTLDTLKHRVSVPEPGIAEAVDGSVITVLNEEAVVCAALANKGGLSLVASYEAFAVKMLGAIRQDLIFNRHLKEAGRKPSWLSLPVISTSHAWENGKNELSHQDTTLAEALLGEMSDTCRVMFPADWNSALAVIDEVYRTRGEIWNIVCPKRPVDKRISKDQARRLVEDGVIRLAGTGAEGLIITAIGAYQLEQTLKASARLTERGMAHSVNYMLEPGRFRHARDEMEEQILVSPARLEEHYPSVSPSRLFVVHTRPEPLIGCLRPLDTGPMHTAFMGFRNRGGTFDVNGMLFANKITWAHIVARAAALQGQAVEKYLTEAECTVVEGRAPPDRKFWSVPKGAS